MPCAIGMAVLLYVSAGPGAQNCPAVGRYPGRDTGRQHISTQNTVLPSTAQHRESGQVKRSVTVLSLWKTHCSIRAGRHDTILP